MTDNTNDTTPSNGRHSKRHTVAKFADKYPEFATESSIRFQVFHAATNGMNEFKVIERIGRRVLINEDNFFTWLEAINKATPPHKNGRV